MILHPSLNIWPGESRMKLANKDFVGVHTSKACGYWAQTCDGLRRWLFDFQKVRVVRVHTNLLLKARCMGSQSFVEVCFDRDTANGDSG